MRLRELSCGYSASGAPTLWVGETSCEASGAPWVQPKRKQAMQFSFSIGEAFKLETRGDFLFRLGRREVYWSHATGWSYERVPDGHALG